MDKFIINSCELQLDASDADVLEALEKELPACVKKCGDIKNEQVSEVEKIRKMCSAVHNCFDNVFGEGTATKVIPHANSLDACIKAWQEFNSQLELLNKAKIAQAKTVEKAANKLSAKKA